MGLIPQTLSQSVERYGLGYIRPRHNEIARRLVLGQTATEISRVMGISISRLSIIINSPLFKIVLAKLAKLRDNSLMDINNELKELAPAALNEIAKTALTSPSEKLRLTASQDILDRAGIIKKGQGINIGVQVNIDPIDINKYKNMPEPTVVISYESESDVQSLNISEIQLNEPSGEKVTNGKVTVVDDLLDEDMQLLDDTLIFDVREVPD